MKEQDGVSMRLRTARGLGAMTSKWTASFIIQHVSLLVVEEEI
jgi:hypothetical protein